MQHYRLVKWKLYLNKPVTPPEWSPSESRSCGRRVPAGKQRVEVTTQKKSNINQHELQTHRPHLQNGDLWEVLLLKVGVCDELELSLKQAVERLQVKTNRPCMWVSDSTVWPMKTSSSQEKLTHERFFPPSTSGTHLCTSCSEMSLFPPWCP